MVSLAYCCITVALSYWFMQNDKTDAHVLLIAPVTLSKASYCEDILK